MKECPCGSVFPYTDCCGMLIRGSTVADTAEDLMRSRYTAYTLKDWDYITQTTLPEERKNLPDLSDVNQGVQWKKLEVYGASKGGSTDQEGEVSFVATFTKDGKEEVLQETSVFLKEEGRWYYSGKRSNPKTSAQKQSRSTKPFVRNKAKIGRNDPCSCGSGKKYKKCCGK
jgi:SEC-C motif-containing protein